MARFPGIDAMRALENLVPPSVSPVFKAYLRQLQRDILHSAYEPAADNCVTVRFQDLAYTLMVRRADAAGHNVYIVLAVQYPHNGVAPSGKFPADRKINTQFGAEDCVELLPWQPVAEQMLQLCME